MLSTQNRTIIQNLFLCCRGLKWKERKLKFEGESLMKGRGRDCRDLGRMQLKTVCAIWSMQMIPIMKCLFITTRCTKKVSAAPSSGTVLISSRAFYNSFSPIAAERKRTTTYGETKQLRHGLSMSYGLLLIGQSQETILQKNCCLAMF